MENVRDRDKLLKGWQEACSKLYGRNVEDPLKREFESVRTCMFFGHGLPEDTAKRLNLIVSAGETYELHIATDTPSNNGYDPDHPFARGRVGLIGVSICNIEDLARLFGGMPINKFNIFINAPPSQIVWLALFITYAEKRGIPVNELRLKLDGRLMNPGQLSIPRFPPERMIKLGIETYSYCMKNMPNWSGIHAEAYNAREAGADIVDEMAIHFSQQLYIVDKLIEAGNSPDDFFPKVSTKFAVASDFFEEIAKLRAVRKIWGKIARERYGCKKPESFCPHLISQNQGSEFTAQQPLNNIARAAIQGLGSILGGVDSVHIDSYDEGLGTPSEEAVTVALRTFQILRHEVGVANVLDPLAGSYYIEYLTECIEEKLYKRLEEIESRGGFMECWEKGWFKRELQKKANEWQERIRKKEKIVVGRNEFMTDEEIQVRTTPLNLELEKTAVERVRVFRDKRDNNRVKICLEDLSEAAKNDNEIIPSLIEASRENATLGEMMGVLREVYGWGIYGV